VTELQIATHPKLDAVLDKLERVRPSTGDGFRARCPVHGGTSDDDMAIRPGAKWINIHCFAGCDYDDIRRELGLEWADLVLDDTPAAQRKSKRRDWRAIELETMACAVRLQHEPEVLKRLRFGHVIGERESCLKESPTVEVRNGRGWSKHALGKLGVGWDGRRLTLPVRTADSKLHDVLRYDPFAEGRTRKVLAGQGKSRLPWPAPEYMPNGDLFLVEGEGTAISLTSIGYSAVALPGSIGKPRTDVQRPGSWQGAGWHRKWAERFVRFRRVVLMPDSDQQGRALMTAARYDLEKLDVSTYVLDLGGDDGGDIGDWVRGAWDGKLRKQAHRWLKELIALEAGVLVE
jgi:hypothetical protein